MNKDQPKTVTSRIVVQHTHKVSNGKPVKKQAPKQDPRIGKARRLLDEVELLEERAETAEAAVLAHPLAEDLADLRIQVEWLETGLANKSRLADARCDKADELLDKSNAKAAEAEKWLAESRQLKNEASRLKNEARAILADNRRQLEASRQNGSHGRLRGLERQFNLATHKLAKKGREARVKAEKVRKRLNILLEEIAPLLQEVRPTSRGK